MLTVETISLETKNKISSIRWDRIIEKHEGPFTWKNELEPSDLPLDLKRFYPDFNPIDDVAQFMEIGSYDVLLPIGRTHHPNITILKHFFSQDLEKMVIYLKDTTHYEDSFDSGFVAICDLIKPENFYLATLYHEWFIVDYV